MSRGENGSPKRHLPSPVPDLVVTPRGGEWVILRISPSLARLIDVSPAEAQGRRLRPLFTEMIPDLGELAAEVLERERSLTGLRVNFPAADGIPLSVEVHPGGLTEDFLGRTVAFYFRTPTAEEKAPVSFAGLVGTSPAMREVFRKIALYAPSDAAVVITGETGTGKELVARALHEMSPRKNGPFVAVNCSAIAGELLESELFGHEKGAFTGAVRTHRGRFERADEGTLFLDEIGDMPRHTQAKLLRALEEGCIERVGAEEERKVDARIVAATNVPLEQAVSQGHFRADLYHRLSVLRIHLPPLRERRQDIPALTEHFLEQFRRRYGKRIERLTPEALALLQSYLWPGNVRELRNVLERVFVETQSEVIGARAFREWIRERRDFFPGDWSLAARESHLPNPLVTPYPPTTDRPLLTGPSPVLEAEVLPVRSFRSSTRPADLDADEIRKAYRAAAGNFTAAARLLGVHRATLYRYLDKLGLSRKTLEKNEKK